MNSGPLSRRIDRVCVKLFHLEAAGELAQDGARRTVIGERHVSRDPSQATL